MAERYGAGVKGTEVLDAKGKRRYQFSPTELAQYGEYCKNDVELTHNIFYKMMAAGFPPIELKLIDLTLKMYVEPVLKLDARALELHLEDTAAQKQGHLVNALSAIGRKDLALKQILGDEETRAGIRKELMSNPKFAAILEALVDAEGKRVVPSIPMKISMATGKETYAFAKSDEPFKALLQHEDVRVQALCAARLGTKSTLEETRTQRFINIGQRNGVFPVPLKYYAAHTGRWGGCLVADTAVLVYDTFQGVVTKRITDVLADDLVWDGVEFVMHEGVQFSGFQEVITWDNVTGTEDHVVFTDAGEISLRDAMQGAHCIQTPAGPSQDAVDAARRLADDHQE
jgi:hypothetical protein